MRAGLDPARVNPLHGRATGPADRAAGAETLHRGSKRVRGALPISDWRRSAAAAAGGSPGAWTEEAPGEGAARSRGVARARSRRGPGHPEDRRRRRARSVRGALPRAHSTSPAVAPPQFFTTESRTAKPPLGLRLELEGEDRRQARMRGEALEARDELLGEIDLHATDRELQPARSGRVSRGLRSRPGRGRGSRGERHGRDGSGWRPHRSPRRIRPVAHQQHRHHGHHAEEQDGPHGQEHELLHGESLSFPASTRPRRASFS